MKKGPLLFGLHRGWRNYPVLWGYNKPVLQQSLLTNQDFFFLAHVNLICGYFALVFFVVTIGPSCARVVKDNFGADGKQNRDLLATTSLYLDPSKGCQMVPKGCQLTIL